MPNTSCPNEASEWEAASADSDQEIIPATEHPNKENSDTAEPTSRRTEVDAERSGAWEPLQIPIFRYFWIASIFSNLGTWIHEVGAGWLMTQLDASPEMVSAVRVAMSIPMTLMAIPAGVLADRLDRRQILIATQWVLMSTAATLATLTLTGRVTAWWLLSLTFVTGIAMVMHILSWQSSIPELVPRSQLPRAVALGSISFNLARSVGPALGGVLIALAGTWIAFAANALSFAGVLLVLRKWERQPSCGVNSSSVRASLMEGLRYVVECRPMRNTLVRLSLFMLPAASLWALLPLIVKERLQWDERGFGLLVTTIGIGAVAAAWGLHRLQQRVGMNGTLLITTPVFGIGLGVLGLTTQPIAVVVATVTMGAAWMMTLTTLNSKAQLSLPNKVRARGMSCYYTVMAFSMAMGAFVWGQIGGAFGLATAIQVAAISLLIAAMIGARFSIND